MLEAFVHYPLHYATSGVFGIGADARDKADGIDCAVDVHFQRVHCYLRHKLVTVKAPEHVRSLDYREFRLLYLVILPAALGKLLFGYLKGVAEEGVVLLKVVRFKISYIVFFHNQINSLSPSDRSSFFLVMTCQPFSPPRLYFSSTALATYSGFK